MKSNTKILVKSIIILLLIFNSIYAKEKKIFLGSEIKFLNTCYKKSNCISDKTPKIKLTGSLITGMQINEKIEIICGIEYGKKFKIINNNEFNIKYKNIYADIINNLNINKKTNIINKIGFGKININKSTINNNKFIKESNFPKSKEFFFKIGIGIKHKINKKISIILGINYIHGESKKFIKNISSMNLSIINKVF